MDRVNVPLAVQKVEICLGQQEYWLLTGSKIKEYIFTSEFAKNIPQYVCRTCIPPVCFKS
jgi:hypothetical protein